MTGYLHRIRLRADLQVHAARIITQADVDHDQTACGTVITAPESDNGCVYLDEDRTVTCAGCNSAFDKEQP